MSHGTVPIESVYAQIREFARARNAGRVVLFGSRARGAASPKSDIDLAIQGCDDFQGLENDLQERLWSLLRVDVINLDDDISPELLADIKRDGVTLYEKV